MNKPKIIFSVVLFSIIFLVNKTSIAESKTKRKEMKNENIELATFGGGCFWCIEAVFQMINGVSDVVSGYAGGETRNPSYKTVVSGGTGHAEAIQISFDPKLISYRELLDIFFYMHDPTTLNRQGNDIGTQYRSLILYHNEPQRKLAEEMAKEYNHKGVYQKPIVTEIKAYKEFFTAEDYHQNYYKNNKSQPYCSFVISPKIKKLKEKYKDKLIIE